PEKANLTKQIKRLGMTGQITLLGPIKHEELPPYYHACGLFATASLSEMNSISMLEAMASGLYVLQRLDIYNKAQISKGENGDIFNSAAELAVLIKEEASLNANERRARRDKVTAFTKKYGKKEFIEAVLNVYERAKLRYEITQGSKK
ncbi:MAG: glycosyltransferase, partial [Oscillospiraceae bacterium]